MEDKHASTQDREKTAKLYRMVMKDHVCPYGLKSRWLLKHHGYTVDDNHLTSEQETDRFMEKHDVDTTPQTFIDNRRVGGYDDLREFFGKSTDSGEETTYRPVIAIFGVSALLGFAVGVFRQEPSGALRAVELFAAFAITLLAVQKLKDVESFSTMFLNYDVLARHWVPYAFIYAYAEALSGILMIAGGTFAKLAAPVALFIGTVGAFSVFKAVYVEKRELKCACVGGDSKVPLGFVSLSENLVMILMGIWMLIK